MAKKKTVARTKRKVEPKGGVAEFVDYIHKDKKSRALIKKGWDEVIKYGKKQGFKFTKEDLHEHLKKKYNLTTLPTGDEPDTCICI